MFVAPLHELVVGFQQVVLDVGPAEHSPPRQRQNTPRHTSCVTHCASERSSGTANSLRTSRPLHATLSSKGQAAQVHATRIQRNRLPPLDIQHEADRTRSAADALDDHALRGRSTAAATVTYNACRRRVLAFQVFAPADCRTHRRSKMRRRRCFIVLPGVGAILSLTRVKLYVLWKVARLICLTTECPAGSAQCVSKRDHTCSRSTRYEARRRSLWWTQGHEQLRNQGR